MSGNIPYLTSPTEMEPQLPGEGVVDGSIVEAPGSSLVGKRSSIVIMSEQEGKVSTTSKASQTSASCQGLFWLEESLHTAVCGSRIGSKQGLQRFCILSVVGETSSCGLPTNKVC
jgi:hypothetical protein